MARLERVLRGVEAGLRLFFVTMCLVTLLVPAHHAFTPAARARSPDRANCKSGVPDSERATAGLLSGSQVGSGGCTSLPTSP